MAKLNVNPTRMELTKLKKQMSFAVRGHKLLKDKQDELMRRFIILVRENNELRKKLDSEMSKVLSNFALAKSDLPKAFSQEMTSASSGEVGLQVGRKNIMNVVVPTLNFDFDDDKNYALLYGYVNSGQELEDAVMEMSKLMKELFKLSEIEKSCQLLADEIEKTRRRVNALEYRTIPQLTETIYFIKMKLEENERANITRLIKVKDMRS